MDEKEIDDRLKNLFLELVGFIEPADGKKGAAHAVRNEDSSKKGAAVPGDPALAERICPFLKTSWDASIRYAYPHHGNACYRQQKSRLVSLSEQEKFCLGKQHRHCPVYNPRNGQKQAGRPHPLVQFFKGRLFRKDILDRS